MFLSKTEKNRNKIKSIYCFGKVKNLVQRLITFAMISRTLQSRESSKRYATRSAEWYHINEFHALRDYKVFFPRSHFIVAPFNFRQPVGLDYTDCECATVQRNCIWEEATRSQLIMIMNNITFFKLNYVCCFYVAMIAFGFIAWMNQCPMPVLV